MELLNFTEIPIWNVFVLFLIIASNYIGELFPCRIQSLLVNNVYLKHFIAFLTLMFFVVLTDSSSQKKKFMVIFTDSIKLYFLWLLLINSDKKFFVLGLILLAILYILQLIKNDYINNKKINEEINEEINNKNKERLSLIKNIEKVIFLIFFIVLVLGFIIYMGEKKIEYKNKFSYITFIFGKPSCRGKSPEVKYLEAFTSAFK
mgnify:FL=1|jgi:hypothetical protein